jgi:hypothetical protein
MKIINQRFEFPRYTTKEIPEALEVYEKLKKIEKTITTKYGPCDYSVKLFETTLLTHFLKSLEGKTIVDLGCGARQSWEYDMSLMGREKRMYDPWLCRTLNEFGANVIGIDGGESPQEEYRHIQQNLMSSGKLIDSFPDKSIDLVCAFGLFDSPSLRDGQGLFHFLIERFDRKVKDNGFFVFEATGTGYYDENKWQEFLKERERK